MNGTNKMRFVDYIFIIELILFSIEYVGGDGLSVYRLLIFPLSLIGLGSLIGKRVITGYMPLVLPMVLFFVWYSYCRFICDDNWLMPIFIIPFVLFEVLYLMGAKKPSIDYSICFAMYSLPHLITWVTGTYSLDSGRFAGLHSDPNFCGLFLIVSILASIFLLIRRGKTNVLVKLLLFFNILACIYLLLWSGSRGAIISVSLCLLIVFWNSSIGKGIKITATLVTVGLLFSLFSYIQSLPNWIDASEDKIGALLARMKPEALLDGASRTSTWRIVIDRLKDNPFFLPLGRENAMFGLGIEFTHNTYLDFLVECGVFVGLIAVIVILIACIKSLKLFFEHRLVGYDSEMLIIAFAVMIQLFTLSALSQKILWLMLVFILVLPKFYSRKI